MPCGYDDVPANLSMGDAGAGEIVVRCVYVPMDECTYHTAELLEYLIRGSLWPIGEESPE